MTSAHSQTIEALEEVLSTVQRELARLSQEVDSAATIPPPPMATMPPPPMATMPPPPMAMGRPHRVSPPRAFAPPRTGPTQWRRPQGAQVTSPSFSISPELAFRFGGISLVVLSAIFFVSTAINREWIGPTAQLVLATVMSLVFIAQSFRFDARRWRVTFAAGGAAGLFISGVVGHLGLDILSMPVVTGWLAVAIAAFLGLARAHDSQLLALLAAPATLIGSILLEAAGVDSPTAIAGTAAIWSLGLAVTCYRQGWFGARGAGAGVAGLLVLGVALGPSLSGLAIGTAVATLGALASLGVLAWQQASELRPNESGRYSTLAALEARLFAFFIPLVGIVIGDLVDTSERFASRGLEAAGWAVLVVGLVGGALATLAKTRFDGLMITLHQLASIGTGLIGLAIIVQGPALLVGLLAATATSAVLARETNLREAAGAAVVLGVGVLVWSGIIVLGGLTMGGLTLGQALATGLVIASLFCGLWMMRHLEEAPSTAGAVWLATLLWVAALWQGAPQAQMWISISWVAMSVGLLLSRPLWNAALAKKHFADVIKVALVTLAATGLKLIFVDLVAVDILWRAALFFVIGGTFLRLAFVLPEMLASENSGETSVTEDDESREPSLM